MKISTKGRYALRVMLDIAGQDTSGVIPLKVIAGRQGITLKYLEQIVPALCRAGLLTGTRGAGGGYRLAVRPETCREGDILRAVEGELAPVACLEGAGKYLSPARGMPLCRVLGGPLPGHQRLCRQHNAFRSAPHRGFAPCQQDRMSCRAYNWGLAYLSEVL